MAKIFQDGDLVTKEWLNKVSKTVTDACGDQVTPTNLRIHIGAETAGAAGDVQAELNAHKADIAIHYPDAPNDTKEYVRGQGEWKVAALTEAPMDDEIYGRRNGAWTVTGGAGTVTDHQTLANRSSIDAHPKSAITGLEQDITNFNSHRANILNPHQTTALQVGADTSAEVDGKIATHLNTAPHIIDAPSDGNDYTRRNAGWSLAPDANIEEYSLITAGSAGTVAADVYHTDFSGHPHAGANTYVTVLPNHLVSIVHGDDIYRWIGIKPINLGVDGNGTVNVQYSLTGSADHTAMSNRDAADSHPQAAVTGLVADLAGKSATSHNHDADYDALGVGEAHADAVQANLDTHAGNGAMHIGHATADTNQYVSKDGVWALLDVTAPAVETDHTKMTNRDQPNQHSIGSVGISGGVQLQDEIDRVDASVATKAESAALTSHAGDVNLHYFDAASDGKNYVRKNKAWSELPVSGAGDLKSDFSVQMVGSPVLDQDIATKGSSELSFTLRIQGYSKAGEFKSYTDDIDDRSRNEKYYTTNAPGTFPSNFVKADGGFLETNVVLLSSKQVQRLTGGFIGANVGREWTRYRNGGAWSEWRELTAALWTNYDNAGSNLSEENAQDAIDTLATRSGGLTQWAGTQAAYDALGSWDNNTIYNIT